MLLVVFLHKWQLLNQSCHCTSCFVVSSYLLLLAVGTPTNKGGAECGMLGCATFKVNGGCHRRSFQSRGRARRPLFHAPPGVGFGAAECCGLPQHRVWATFLSRPCVFSCFVQVQSYRLAWSVLSPYFALGVRAAARACVVGSGLLPGILGFCGNRPQIPYGSPPPPACLQVHASSLPGTRRTVCAAHIGAANSCGRLSFCPCLST